MDYHLFKKKLLYKSANRGWKETDILLGEFTKQNISLMNENQLMMLDALLDEPDVEIFNWIIKKRMIPEKHNNEVMHMLQEFRYKN